MRSVNPTPRAKNSSWPKYGWQPRLRRGRGAGKKGEALSHTLEEVFMGHCNGLDFKKMGVVG